MPGLVAVTVRISVSSTSVVIGRPQHRGSAGAPGCDGESPSDASYRQHGGLALDIEVVVGLQEEAAIAARVESLRRTAMKPAEGIQSVDLLDEPVVVDEIVAQSEARRMATELEFATERIQQVVEARAGDGLTSNRRVTVHAQRARMVSCPTTSPWRFSGS